MKTWEESQSNKTTDHPRLQSLLIQDPSACTATPWFKLRLFPGVVLQAHLSIESLKALIGFKNIII